MTETARRALAHPQILRGAWMRVNAWYGSGNLAPEPELSVWRLHPEDKLRELRNELREGTWAPSAWIQLPYPKKGARLRHYVQPTVKDQVAFMAHMVLLGPLIDSQIPSFAFGNRWYRPVVWNRRLNRPRWELRAYPLLTRRTFLPYARDHGMFRRVTHWTAARMVGAEVREEDYVGRVQHPDDHDQQSLPAWSSPNWWTSAPSEQHRVYWAALDIQLAYPCVQIERLDAGMREMLDKTDASRLSNLLSDYPAPVLTTLVDTNARNELVNSTICALRKLRIRDPQIPDGAWKPHHLRGALPDPGANVGFGIPTGLAISGLLFNAALYRFDVSVSDHLHCSERPRDGAFIRFADDMYLLALSPASLCALMDTVGCALADNPEATLADRTSASNLYLAVDKVRPPEIKCALVSYLKSRGWTRCERCKADAQDPPGALQERISFQQWWSDEGSSSKRHVEALRRASVGPQDLGPFVTTLVERLSEIGTDTLGERFGQAAEDRLARLHELARFDIDDEQVRPDTRRTFAVNRLVRAWLPDDSSRAARALEEIRASIALVLRSTPWKFSLWRAVVRAAARRAGGPDAASEHKVARDWLRGQLRYIAAAPGSAEDENYAWWPALWPEESRDEHLRGGDWQRLYLSFHRAAFWQALADAVRALWWHAERTGRPGVHESGITPTRWTVRAVPERRHRDVALFLGRIEEWTGVLYPDGQASTALKECPWEVDQIVATVLASRQQTIVARAYLRARPLDRVLTLPASMIRRLDKPTRTLLRAAGRVQRRAEAARTLNTAALAHVSLSGPDRRLPRFLFPENQASRLGEATCRPQHAAAVGIALGCAEHMDPDFAADVVPEPGQFIRRLGEDPLALVEYRHARRLLLGRERTEP